MLGKALRWLSDRLFGPVGRAVARTPITANSVTVTGVVIVGVACWYIARGRILLGGIILIAGSLFDTLDGPVAKARGTTGTRGAFLDSTLDRLSDALIFGSIAYYFAMNRTAGGFVLALICLVLGFLTSYIRARAEGLGFSANVGLAERAPRIIIVLAGLVFNVLIPALAVLAVLSVITVVHRFAHVWKQTANPGP